MTTNVNSLESAVVDLTEKESSQTLFFMLCRLRRHNMNTNEVILEGCLSYHY